MYEVLEVPFYWLIEKVERWPPLPSVRNKTTSFTYIEIYFKVNHTVYFFYLYTYGRTY